MSHYRDPAFCQSPHDVQQVTPAFNLYRRGAPFLHQPAGVAYGFV
jgi:hypothetical protein